MAEDASGSEGSGLRADHNSASQSKSTSESTAEETKALKEQFSNEQTGSGMDEAEVRRRKSPLIDKTKLEVSGLTAANTELQNEQALETELDPVAQRRRKAPVADRTKLDVDAVRAMAAKTVAEQEDRLREELELRPPQPVRPFQPIEKFRLATTCSSSWDRMTGSGCVKFCEQCKLQVYDFSKTEQSEAEELIFKREGKKDFVLYKRKDGTFLTLDCPVGVKRKQTIVTVGVVAVLLTVGCIFLLSSLPPPTKTVTATQQPSPSTNFDPNVKGGESADGWIDLSSDRNSSPKSNGTNFNPGATPGQFSSGGQYPGPIPMAAPPAQDSGPNAMPPTAPSSAPATAEPVPPSVQSTGQMPATGPSQQAPAAVSPEQAPVNVPSSAESSLNPQTTQQPGIWQAPGR